MLVIEALAAALGRLGVDSVFGLLGNGNLQLVSTLTQAHGAAWHPARHPAAAVAMADGWSRVTGEVGVCTVFEGHGVTGAVSSLAEAARSRTPLLLVAGDTPITALRHPQDVDETRLLGAIGVPVQRLRGPDTAADDLTRAYWRAVAERKPVAVLVPADVQRIESRSDAVSATPPPRPTIRPDDSTIAQLADALRAARRPVLLAGRGAVASWARPALEALAYRIGALVATTAPAKGLFAGNPYDLGIVGAFASATARRLLARADLVLVFGASLDPWATEGGRQLPPDAAVVQCDIDATQIGAHAPVTRGVVGDAAATAAALTAELSGLGVRSPGLRSDPVRAELAAHPKGGAFRPESTATAADPRALLQALDELLPDDRTVVVDAGHFMGFAAGYMSVPDAQGFVLAGGFGAVGLGLAQAIGAAIGRPDRLAVAVLGDGGAMMHLGELDTAVRTALPLLIVVCNDAAYGAKAHRLAELDLPTELALFPETDFAAVATSLGANGLTVRRPADLDDLTDWLDGPEGPLMVDCKVTRVRAPWWAAAYGPGGWNANR
jgi:thiamine pyrophosphate-dependent acetolactate synthase large subunit-like protein